MRLILLTVAFSAVGCQVTRPSLPPADGPDAVWLFGREVPCEPGAARVLVDGHVPPGLSQKDAIKSLTDEGFKISGQTPGGGTTLRSSRFLTNRWGVCQSIVVDLSEPNASKNVRVADVRIGGIEYGERGALLAGRPDVRTIVGKPVGEAVAILSANGFRVWPAEKGSDGQSKMSARFCTETGLGAEVIRLTVGIGADGNVTDLVPGEPQAYDVAIGILPARDIPFAEQPGAYLFLPARAATVVTLAICSGAFMR